MKVADTERDYYVLQPLMRIGTLHFVPCENRELVERMLPPLTPEEAREALARAKSRRPEWIRDFRRRSELSRKTLNSGDRSEVLTLIKNICAHKNEILKEGKRIHTTDDYFLKEAERLIAFEFSQVLSRDYDEVLEWIRAELNGDEAQEKAKS